MKKGKWEDRETTVMGSLVVKLDAPTQQRLKNSHSYSDVDMLSVRGSQNLPDKYNFHRNSLEGEIPMVYDVDAVKVSIRNILMWRVGESVLRPDFGHSLKQSMYSQITDFNKEAVCQEIKRAIEVNEPRVDVISVDARKLDDEEDTNALRVRVAYRVKANPAQDGKAIVEEATVSGR